MSSVFLCHASEDEPSAEEIQLALSNAGCEVFYDAQSLPPAGDYQARIRTAIRNCDVFVFIASATSIAPGRFSLTELKFVRERWPSPVGRVLAVATAGFEPRKLPTYLQASTVLTVSGHMGTEVRAAVEGMLREVRSKHLRRWSIALGLGGAVLLATLTAYYLLARIPQLSHSHSDVTKASESRTENQITAPAPSTALKVFTDGESIGPEGVTFSPKGDLFSYIAAGATGVIKIFDVASWKLTKQLTVDDASNPPFPWFFASAFSPEGSLLAAATWKDVILYNTNDWSIRNRIGYRWVYSISFSPDGRTLVTGEHRYEPEGNAVLATIRLSGVDGTFLRTIAVLPGSVGSVTFSHDGNRIAAGMWDGTVRIWDVAGRSPPVTISATGGDGHVIFNRDSTWLASGSSVGAIKLWSAATGRLLRTLTWPSTSVPGVGGKNVFVNAFALSPDGRRLASNENGNVALWDAVSGTLLKNYLYDTKQQQYSNIGVVFSPDGRLLAESNEANKVVIVWRVIEADPTKVK
jgi:WD40 repeat protein